MKEIATMIRPDEKLENFERAYNLAVADFFASVGAADQSLKWLWRASCASLQ